MPKATPAGEMKHGPIALIDKDMPVVVLAPRDRLYEKTVSNLMEVKARHAPVIAFVAEGERELGARLRMPCLRFRTRIRCCHLFSVHDSVAVAGVSYCRVARGGCGSAEESWPRA
jgi:glucosamine 6-phosphate synthetase-like amidotransferase/phosphosugar isomerase protein